VIGNSIHNPGKGTDPAAVHAGIAVSHGTSVAANVAAANITIIGNTIVDDQVAPTMLYGLSIGNDLGYPSSGLAANNAIQGAVTTDIYLLNTDNRHFSLLHNKLGKFAMGLSYSSILGLTGLPESALDVAGDIISRDDVDQTSYTALLGEASKSASSYMLGVGMNVRFNKTTSRWEARSLAGVNDGFAAVMSNPADGAVWFFPGGSDGAGSPANPKSLTDAQFQALLRWKMMSTGTLVSSGIAFSSLGTPAVGSAVYCTDCKVTTPCTGSGSGAWAFRSATSGWACPF
jgi:hypothetical protein